MAGEQLVVPWVVMVDVVVVFSPTAVTACWLVGMRLEGPAACPRCHPLSRRRDASTDPIRLARTRRVQYDPRLV